MNIIPGKYNANKLRYGKIAICSDSDSDGFHIGLLIMAAIYKLAPEFLLENRLCWLRSPLYIEKIGKTNKDGMKLNNGNNESNPQSGKCC